MDIVNQGLKKNMSTVNTLYLFLQDSPAKHQADLNYLFWIAKNGLAVTQTLSMT